MALTDPALEDIRRKIDAGQRLDEADGLTLMTTSDLHALGELADSVNRRRNGGRVYYNVNRHINYTNLCVLRCKFCSFARAGGADGAYELSLEQIAEIARQAGRDGATEVHVTGGLHPNWRIDHYEAMLQAISRADGRLHIKAFTAVEIAHVARLSGLTLEATLCRLIQAGLKSLPGGGAEIFDEQVHQAGFAAKLPAEGWFEVHRLAHQMGLRSNATMLFGHVETPAQRVRHLVRLRNLQDRTGGFQCLVPLSFIPAGSAWGHLPGPTGVEELRTIAAARLMLDNIPHIKAFWVMLGVKQAQLALDFGADDLDGTVQWYDITKAQAGKGKSPNEQSLTVQEIRRLIVQAGRAPVQRDSLYQPI